MNFFIDALLSAFQLLLNFDPEIYQIAWLSIRISLIATLIAAVFGIIGGIYIAILDFPGRNLLFQILNTLMAMPTVMIGLILYGLLSRRGLLGDWGILYTETAVIIGETCLILPMIINMSRVAVQTADPRMLMTLKMMNASPLQQLIPIMNELRYALLAGVITGFGRAIGEIGAAMMLGGNIQGSTRTMTTAIALETSKGEFELGLALGIVLLVIAFLINIVLQSLQTKN